MEYTTYAVSIPDPRSTIFDETSTFIPKIVYEFSYNDKFYNKNIPKVVKMIMYCALISYDIIIFCSKINNIWIWARIENHVRFMF